MTKEKRTTPLLGSHVGMSGKDMLLALPGRQSPTMLRLLCFIPEHRKTRAGRKSVNSGFRKHGTI